MGLIGKLLGGILVVIAVAVGALFLIPADRLGALVSDQLSKQLGRSVTLSDISLSFYPVFGVEAKQLVIANADWSDNGPMLSADRALIGVEVLPALSGDIKFKAIEIDGPQIRLERQKDGRANWLFFPEDTTSAAPAGTGSDSGVLPAFSLDRLAVANGQFTFLDADALPTFLRDMDMDLTWPDQNGPMTINATLRPFSDAVKLQLTARQPNEFIAGQPSDLSLEVSTTGGSLTYTGLLGMAPELSGSFVADITDAAGFAAALGQSGIELPEGMGQRIKGAGDVTVTQAMGIALRNGKLTIDANTLALNADVDLSDKPYVTAQIESDALDFSAFMAADSGADTTNSAPGWSKSPLDASALGLMDGEISLRAGSIDLGDMTLGATRTLLTIDRSRAVFELREIQAYDGTITGQFVANNRNGLSVGGNLAIAGVALEPLLTDAAGLTRLAGDAAISLKFLGVGQSVDAIMKSLSGDGSMTAGPGVISGINLDQVFRSGDPSGGTTVFDTLTGSFTLSKGVLRNDDMAMGLPRLTTTGSGEVNLGQQSLDYTIVVADPSARSGRGFGIPVRINGSWADPRIRADVNALINQNFADEKEKLKTEVRDKVNDKLEQQLGLRVEEGQKVEDVIKEKVEEEVGKKLLQLFNK